MVDSVPSPQNWLVNTEGQESCLSLAKFSPATGKEQVTPKWLENFVEKKRSMVPLSMLIDDLVNKCLGKSPKVKKAMTKARINFHKNSRCWSAKIATPPDGSSCESLAPQDCQITKVDLGKGNYEVDMEFFEASNKKIAHRMWKDGQEMKETIKNMTQYINAILHPEAKLINDMSAIIDVSSTTNQQSLENLHKCKSVGKIVGEWV